MFNVFLACEDANSKLVEIITVADVDAVGNSLLQICELRFLLKSILHSKVPLFHTNALTAVNEDWCDLKKWGGWVGDGSVIGQDGY